MTCLLMKCLCQLRRWLHFLCLWSRTTPLSLNHRCASRCVCLWCLLYLAKLWKSANTLAVGAIVWSTYSVRAALRCCVVGLCGSLQAVAAWGGSQKHLSCFSQPFTKLKTMIPTTHVPNHKAQSKGITNKYKKYTQMPCLPCVIYLGI